ncbi:MAG: hypothetical protein QG673_1113 [Pseudomonadota bacterium]|nr:hypothetical protein [Pseudomonadota bacterium]
MKFCPISSARQEDVTLDVLQELNEVPKQQIFNELTYMVKKSKYNNYRIDAAYAFMLIYAYGLRGESTNFQKAYYWCNQTVKLDKTERIDILDCNKFIESTEYVN